ncbi:hypothetical protein H6F86_31250 [Phormidium sp. FACHB-592]|uniref:Uncharacterized protein n=1 Tax=Stenomitos frigidus AS-A4 TaxID=2933935 RepID=A0ABV0KWZ3_9CYAN|nr:hypothetical protein [Phormidium sp. FACHB-592]MBD2078287.1 hypothetical protein [Phormidium sp. FACHB-592]
MVKNMSGVLSSTRRDRPFPIHRAIAFLVVPSSASPHPAASLPCSPLSFATQTIPKDPLVDLILTVLCNINTLGQD